MAALGSQTIASSYEQLLHVDRDGGGNGTTHVAVKDGDNGTTFPITLATDAIMITSTNRLEFGDDGTYIHQSADGVLDLVSDTEIEINPTTIDMNGALDLSGNLTISGSQVDIQNATGDRPILNVENTNADNSPSAIHLYKNSSSPANSDQIGDISWYAKDDGGTKTRLILFRALQTDIAASSDDSKLSMYTAKAGSEVETLTLESGNAKVSGSLGVGVDAPSDSIVKIQNDTGGDNSLFVNHRVADVGVYIQHDATHSNPNGGLLKVYSNSSSGGTRNLVEFVNAHASADACTVLKIENAGDAPAIDVDGTLQVSKSGSVPSTMSFVPATSQSSQIKFMQDDGTTQDARIFAPEGAQDLAFEAGTTEVLRLDTDSRISLSCLLYTSPSPRDAHESRMPSSA